LTFEVLADAFGRNCRLAHGSLERRFWHCVVFKRDGAVIECCFPSFRSEEGHTAKTTSKAVRVLLPQSCTRVQNKQFFNPFENLDKGVARLDPCVMLLHNAAGNSFQNCPVVLLALVVGTASIPRVDLIRLSSSSFRMRHMSLNSQPIGRARSSRRNHRAATGFAMLLHTLLSCRKSNLLLISSVL